jgi:hypothetical protein
MIHFVTQIPSLSQTSLLLFLTSFDFANVLRDSLGKLSCRKFEVFLATKLRGEFKLTCAFAQGVIASAVCIFFTAIYEQQRQISGASRKFALAIHKFGVKKTQASDAITPCVFLNSNLLLLIDCLSELKKLRCVAS